MKYVVLGSSAAGVNGARELRRLSKNAEIIMVSKDEEIYSRCILHHYLSGIRTRESLCFVEQDFAERYGIRMISGAACTAVDAEKKEVALDNGDQISYDKLLIAAGAGTFFPPIPGLRESENCIGFRNIGDVEKIRQKVDTARHIVILGGGLVGLDALSGLLHLKKTPSLVEAAPWLLFNQLDKKASGIYQKAFEKEGAAFHVGCKVEAIQQNDQGLVTGIQLEGEQVIPCDFLIVTTGVRANIGFLTGSGIHCSRKGLDIDPAGRTNVTDVYGAGDVTGKSPIWPAAVKEGIVAASNMAGIPMEMTDFFISKATMNFQGIPAMSLGIHDAPDDSYRVEIQETDGIYKKLIHKEGRIYGAVLSGDLSYGGILTQLIANHIDVSKIKKPLFKVDYSDFFNIRENFEFYYEEAAQ